jgi:hypothetical protein
MLRNSQTQTFTFAFAVPSEILGLSAAAKILGAFENLNLGGSLPNGLRPRCERVFAHPDLLSRVRAQTQSSGSRFHGLSIIACSRLQRLLDVGLRLRRRTKGLGLICLI